MESLNALYNLSTELSLANDKIIEDPNCESLIQELIILLDKYYLPDISLYSIQSINHLLDINPAYTTLVKKYGGVEKIVIMTQNIEFIDLAESAIKAIEKMSLENPSHLLISNSFTSVLNLIDFFDTGLKKSAIKACVNMSLSVTSFEIFSTYIIPVIPSLTNLTKLDANEMIITSSAITCFLYLLTNVKSYNIHAYGKNTTKIENSILQYGMLENIYEIVIYYLDNSQDKKISVDLIRNILKIFQLLCNLSNEATNLLLNLNLLEIIYNLMKKELLEGEVNDVSIINSKNNIPSFMNDVFPILIGFFPNNKTDCEEKITTKSNRVFYNYLSENIIKLLVSNILNISSCGTLIQVVKLLNIYTRFSDTSHIISYLNASNLAQIISKLLDTNDTFYLQEILTLVEILLQKAGNYYIKFFLREGIVENIKNFRIIGLDPNEDKINIQSKINDEEDYEGEVIDEYNDYDEYLPEEDFILSRENKLTYDNEFVEIDNGKLKSTMEKDYSSDIIDYNDYKDYKDNTALQVDQPNSPSFINNSENVSLPKTADFVNQLLKSTYNIKKLDEKVESSTDINLTSPSYKKKVNSNISNSEQNMNQLLYKRLNEFKENYLTFDKIKNFLQDEKENPMEILENLEQLKSEILKEDFNIKNVQSLINILTNKDTKLTLWEIEKSEIFIILSQFIDKNFIVNYKNIIEEDIKLTMNTVKKLHQISYKSTDIFSNLKVLFKCFQSEQQLIEFIKLIQNSITLMNCFVVYANDNNQYKYNPSQFLKNVLKEEKKYRMKCVYSGTSAKKLLEELKNEDHETVKLLNEFFDKLKEKSITISAVDTFNEISKILFEERKFLNLNFFNDLEKLMKTNEKYFQLNFYLKFTLNDHEQIFSIEKGWTISNVLDELRKKYSKQELKSVLHDLPIHFEIEYNSNQSAKEFDPLLQTSTEKNLLNPNPDTSGSELELSGIFSNFTPESNLDEKLFNFYYRNNIITNPDLYEIKRLSPSLYLLAVMELSLNSFPHLFISSNYQTTNPFQFENSKVSNLLLKQIRDPSIISYNSIPKWCRSLPYSYPFIANFNSRYLLFKTCSFEVKRGLINLHNYLKNYSGETTLNEQNINISKSSRQKVVVERNDILLYAGKVMKELGKSNGYLEFEYLNETGSGLGPTLEFYSLVIEKLRTNKNLWYKTTDKTLFPAPILNEENIQMFTLLGFIIARALYDDRLIDVPLSSIFWDLVLGKVTLIY